MPSVAVENNAPCIDEFRIFESLFEYSDNVLLALLPVGIKLIQSRGKLAGFAFLPGVEKLDYCLRHVHAPGGIHSRRDAKRHICSRKLPLFVSKLRDSH